MRLIYKYYDRKLVVKWLRLIRTGIRCTRLKNHCRN